MIYPTLDEHANHYTTDEHANHYTTDEHVNHDTTDEYANHYTTDEHVNHYTTDAQGLGASDKKKKNKILYNTTRGRTHLLPFF